jgi:RNA polymerase sigma factor (sigma-70 family)
MNKSMKSPRRDSFAFERFFRDHYASVARYVARRLPRECWDDVVSNTFIVAWRKYEQIETPNLLWLYRIAGYEVAHERRRLARHPQREVFGDLELTDSHPLEEVIDLATAFSQLSEDDADLLRMIHWEQLERADVAELLGCSVNTLNVRYHRAKDRLATAIEQLRDRTDIPNRKERP